MPLNRSERERISDNKLKIQSVAASLHQLDNSKVPHLDEIQDCLEDAEQSLKNALSDPK